MTDSDNEEVEYETELINVGPYSFNLTTVSFMPLHVLMRNASKGVEISGQKVWCGSIGVCQYIIDHSNEIVGRNIIELGAGTGLLGMLSRRLGASFVFLSDNDPRSLEHMKHDVSINNIDNTHALPLDWFEPDLSELTKLMSTMEVGSELPLVILAGDVLYKRILLQPFFKTVTLLLAMYEVESKLILCHVPRAGIEQQDVVATAVSFGLKVREVDSSEWLKDSVIDNTPKEDYSRASLYIIEINAKS